VEIIEAIILGIIQGITEFLPVSSSAHLVLVPFFFGWQIPEEQAFPFNVLVQLGTLLAVIVYFWKDLISIAAGFLQGLQRRQPFVEAQSRMGWYLILATIPASIVGLLLKDEVEAAFLSPVATALFLYGTAFLLMFSERIGRRERSLPGMTWKDALWIGCSQIMALFPGISRSGATISGGMARHFERPAAGRFSFLMAVPIMLAAGLVALVDLFSMADLGAFLPALTAGFVTAAVVGYLAIHWLLSYMVRHSLRIFAIYCVLVASATLIVSYVGR
jgi:undecaprenyl-diphosphatase